MRGLAPHGAINQEILQMNGLNCMEVGFTAKKSTRGRALLDEQFHFSKVPCDKFGIANC